MIKVEHYFRLRHRWERVGLGQNEFGVCVLDRSENVTFLNQDFQLFDVPYLTAGSRWGKLHASAILQDRGLLAITHDDKLTVCNVAGESDFECTVSQFAENCRQECFGELVYDPIRSELWTSISHNMSQLEILVLDMRSMHIAARKLVNDPFGKSYPSFSTTWKGGRVAMHLDTGGCGDGLYFLNRKGKKVEIDDLEISEIVGWCFSPDHDELITCSPACYINRYKLSPTKYLGGFSGLEEGIVREDGTEYVSPFMVYLSSDRLLVNNDEELSIYDANSGSCEKVEFEIGPNAAKSGMTSGYFVRVFQTLDHVIVSQAEGFFVLPKQAFLADSGHPE